MANRPWKVQDIREATDAARRGERCARCLREAPPQDSDEFTSWKAIGDGQQAFCPDCVTPEEQRAMDEDATAIDEKIRENRLRRMANRQGLRLEKSRRRDPRAPDWGTYRLVDPGTGSVVRYGGSSDYGLNLDEIEAALTE
jgi:hypothetical protein